MQKSLSFDFFLLALFGVLPVLALPIFYDHYALVKASFVYTIAPIWIIILLSLCGKKNDVLVLPRLPRRFFLALSFIFCVFFLNITMTRTPIFDAPVIIRGAFLCLILGFYWGLSSRNISIRAVSQITIIAALVVSVLGIAQVFGIFPLFFVNPGNGGPHATFGNVNMAAEFIVLGLFCLWYLRLREKPKKIFGQASFGLIGIIYSSYLLLLACRSAWLIVVLGLLYLLLRHHLLTLKYILWPVIVGVVLGIFIKNTQFTIPETPLYPSIASVGAMEKKPYLTNPRYEVWRDGLGMIRDHPWFGVGPENYEFSAISYRTGLRARVDESSIYNHPHNEWLKFVIEDGLPFSLILGALIFYLVWRRLRSDIESKNEPEIFFTVGMILFYSIQGTFQFPFTDAVPFVFFALFLARCLTAFPQIVIRIGLFPKLSLFKSTPPVISSYLHFGLCESLLLVICSFLLILNLRLGESQYLIANDSENREAMERACSITSSNWRACMGFAHLFIRRGDYQKSFPVLENMLTKQPNNFLALKMYGLAKIASGDHLNGCLSLRVFDYLLKGQHSQKELLGGFCQKIPPLALGGKNNVLSQYHHLGLGMKSF